MNKDKYLRNLYSYLQEHNYCILKVEHNSRDMLKAVPLNDQEYFDEKGNVKKYSNSKFYSEDSFVSYSISKKKDVGPKLNDNIIIEHFIKLFKDSNKEDKTILLKNIEEYLGNDWSKSIIYILDSISSSSKEVLNYTNTIPISTWSIHKVALDDLNTLLIKRDIKDKEYDNFYLKFLKARKNQINNSTYGPKVKTFLVKQYGFIEEKLSPYSSFFNYIKEMYEKVDLDIFEEVPLLTVVSKINYRKATKLLCIPGYHDTLIKRTITDFMRLIQGHKGIKQLYIEDSGPGVMEIRCYTDNPLTQKEINDEIRDYLIFKKSNVDIPTDKVNIDKYLMSKELALELSENKSVSKKMKL